MGTKLFYYLILLPLSSLPLFVLYGLSNFAAFVLFRIVGYRKAVIFDNLRRSFPRKEEKEISEIGRKYYRHLTDIMVESIKAFTISKSEICERFKLINSEVSDKYFDQGKHVIYVGAHQNNWEWLAVSFAMGIKHKPVGLYTPLTNQFLNEKMRASRMKYGLEMVSTKETKTFLKEQPFGLSATIIAVDQNPSNPKSAYWTTFLQQETAIAYGAEKYAKQYDMPVLFGKISKVKRGYYTMEIIELEENPKEAEYGSIIKKATAMIEKNIQNEPHTWLWSHRRWKYDRPEGMTLN